MSHLQLLSVALLVLSAFKLLRKSFDRFHLINCNNVKTLKRVFKSTAYRYDFSLIMLFICYSKLILSKITSATIHAVKKNLRFFASYLS